MIDSRGISPLTWNTVPVIIGQGKEATVVINNTLRESYSDSTISYYGRKPYLISKEYVLPGENYDYLKMMETKFPLGENNEWVVARKPYRHKDYSLSASSGGYSKEYQDIKVKLVGNSYDAYGLSITSVVNSGATTSVTVTSKSNATGSYYIYAEDSFGNQISEIITISGLAPETTIIIVQSLSGAEHYAYKLRTLIQGQQIPIAYNYSYALPYFKAPLWSFSFNATVAAVPASYRIVSHLNQILRSDTGSVLCSGTLIEGTYYTSEGVILSTASGNIMRQGGFYNYEEYVSYATAGFPYPYLKYITRKMSNYSGYFLYSDLPLMSFEASYARTVSYSYLNGVVNAISIVHSGGKQFFYVECVNDSNYVINWNDGDDTWDNRFASNFYYSGMFSGESFDASFHQDVSYKEYKHVYVEFDTV